MNLPPPDMTMPSLMPEPRRYYSADTVRRLLAAERERWLRRIEVLSAHDGGKRRAWHSEGAWLNAGEVLAAIRSAE